MQCKKKAILRCGCYLRLSLRLTFAWSAALFDYLFVCWLAGWLVGCLSVSRIVYLLFYHRLHFPTWCHYKWLADGQWGGGVGGWYWSQARSNDCNCVVVVCMFNHNMSMFFCGCCRFPWVVQWLLDLQVVLSISIGAYSWWPNTLLAVKVDCQYLVIIYNK